MNPLWVWEDVLSEAAAKGALRIRLAGGGCGSSIESYVPSEWFDFDDLPWWEQRIRLYGRANI